MIWRILFLLIWTSAICCTAAEEPPTTQNINLAPAAAAPAGTLGTAELGNLLRQGPGGATVTLSAQNLRPGNYQVLVGRKSDPAPLFVGMFAIADPEATPDRSSHENPKQDSTTHPASVLNVRVTTELPDTLAPTDIRRIIIADVGGNTFLEGAL